MKKYIILLIIPFLTWCFNNVSEVQQEENIKNEIVDNGTQWNTQEETNDVNSGTVEEVIEIKFTSENLYNTPVREGFELAGDVSMFSEMFENNKNYFVEIDDLLYFNLWRDLMFGENNSNWDLTKLVDCINWGTDKDTLDSFSSQICEWKNIYNVEEDSNFFHIQDTIVKFKDINEGKNISCEYFLDWKYKFPVRETHYRKLEDYLICNKIKNPTSYSLEKNYFYFIKAYETNNCSLLEDTILQKLCDDESEINSTESEK